MVSHCINEINTLIAWLRYMCLHYTHKISISIHTTIYIVHTMHYIYHTNAGTYRLHDQELRSHASLNYVIDLGA